jgi:type II secretory ATPase GspE/PulE/Tfp pilus assembly ATPase PilB-like protein
MTTPAQAMWLRVRESGGRQYNLALSGDKDSYLVGRSDPALPGNVDVTLNDRFVSRHHCAFSWDRARSAWTVHDMKSSNGTSLNGDTVREQPFPLHDGAEIRVGVTVLTCLFSAPSVTVPAIGTTDAAAAGHGAISIGPVEATTSVTPAPEVDDTTIAPVDSSATPILFAPVSHQTDRPASVPDRDNTHSVEQSSPGLRTAAQPWFVMTQESSLTTSDDESPDIRADDDRTTLGRDESQTIATVPSGPPLANEAPAEAEPVATLALESPDAATVLAEAGTLVEPVPTEALPEPPPTGVAEKSAPMAGAESSSRTESDPEVELSGIAAVLVGANLLERPKAANLRRISRETGRTFFRTLADDPTVKYLPQIYRLVAERRGIELIESEKILMEMARPTSWLPFHQADRHGAIMLSSEDGQPTRYATVDPFDIVQRDWLQRHMEGVPQPVLALPQAFQSAIQRLKNRIDEEGDTGENVLIINLSDEDRQRISAQIENVDVPELVNYFLQQAVLQEASDIHVEPTEDFLLVRNRVDGMLHEDTTLPIDLHPEISSRVKILSGMDVAEKRRPQDGRIGSVIRGHGIDVRVSSYPTIYGEKIVMRLLDKDALRPTPEHLGMLARDLRLLYDKLDAPFGLVMISGPTGSGKTTTLYSCLGSIDKKSKNVLTIEDPVEYRMKGVHQMQVNERIGLTFAAGLRTILRQDPDVIMVGECRDHETAGMAIQASLTGHIVFSTIHTNDAVGVITRLLDMGIDRFLVANALTLAIAQRLVRKVCNRCKTPVAGAEILNRLRNDGVSGERLRQLGIEIDPTLAYAAGTGCINCRNTGYQGRQAVLEVFEMTNDARAMIMGSEFNATDLRRHARANGMTTLITHGMHFVEEGITTHSEIIRVLGEAY